MLSRRELSVIMIVSYEAYVWLWCVELLIHVLYTLSHPLFLYKVLSIIWKGEKCWLQYATSNIEYIHVYLKSLINHHHLKALAGRINKLPKSNRYSRFSFSVCDLHVLTSLEKLASSGLEKKMIIMTQWFTIF